MSPTRIVCMCAHFFVPIAFRRLCNNNQYLLKFLDYQTRETAIEPLLSCLFMHVHDSPAGTRFIPWENQIWTFDWLMPYPFILMFFQHVCVCFHMDHDVQKVPVLLCIILNIIFYLLYEDLYIQKWEWSPIWINHTTFSSCSMLVFSYDTYY